MRTDLERKADIEAEQGETALVWYAAYGSNMHADRLKFYLAGGRPPGGRRTYPGCRDSRPPRRTVPVMIPGGIYFALESRAWTGGMALYDPDLPGEAAARAYLITTSQFSDIAAQEMYREPGVDLILGELLEQGRLQLGEGRYETLVCAGSKDGFPLITFTAPWRSTEAALNPPAPAYLAMLARGLHESHRWPASAISAYLSTRPGVAGSWPPAQLDPLVEAAVQQVGSYE